MTNTNTPAAGGEVDATAGQNRRFTEERLRHDIFLGFNRERLTKVINQYHEQQQRPKLPMELRYPAGRDCVRLNRFELYMDFQHRIQARSPFEQTFIIQLAGQPGNDGGYYLCTERGAKNKGYSASMFCNPASPQGGQELVEETLKLLHDLHTEKTE